MCSADKLSGEIIRWNNTPDCRDQKFWSAVKAHPQYPELMKSAEQNVAEAPVSPLPLYLEFSQNGNRENYQNIYFKLRNYGALTVAYCTTGDVKYLNAIEERLKIILSLPTWVLPAHDRELKGYYKKEVLVDLFSALLSGELATLCYILKPALDKALANEVEKALFHNIVDPMEEVINGVSSIERFWWMDGSNNWNPVCKQGIIGAILRLGIEKERIDKILTLFFDHFEKYFKSFGSEGYCDEGLGYWGGSCGEFLLIAALMQQYDRRDILSNEPRMLKAVMYPENIMMAPGYYPAYTDCSIDVQPNMMIIQLRDILLGKRQGFSDDLPLSESLTGICLRLNYPRDNTPSVVKNDAPYSSFADAGCFVMRQMPGSAMSVSFKGGHNTESHNHNDVGVYTIAVDGVPVVLDPGGEIYTGRTFGPQRYESKLLSSYGHSVPMIDGELQTNVVGSSSRNLPRNITPPEAVRGDLLEHDVSPDRCSVRFDLRKVYNHISGIDTLERTFEFDRSCGGKFTVSDEAVFARAMDFDGAVITLGEISELGGNRYKITYKGKFLLLEVVSSAEYNFSIDTIMEDTHHKLPVYRMSFAAKTPCEKITMKFIYTVADR